MTAMRTRVTVTQDHGISGKAPEFVPAREQEVIITLAEPAVSPKFFRSADLPTPDLSWDAGISLRREALNGDDGR